jgi:hypothetical protein
VVDPDDGAGALVAADVDADPDLLIVGEGGLADTCLPGAGREPVALALGDAVLAWLETQRAGQWRKHQPRVPSCDLELFHVSATVDGGGLW